MSDRDLLRFRHFPSGSAGAVFVEMGKRAGAVEDTFGGDDTSWVLELERCRIQREEVRAGMPGSVERADETPEQDTAPVPGS